MKFFITADDFGATPEINAAVISAFKAGSLHGTSLMIGEDSALEAVRLAKANPGLRVGLHLTFADGKSVLPHSEIPDLVDRDRNFPKNPAAAWLRYFFFPKLLLQLQKEVRAQFEAFSKTGLRLSHVDGHHHLHLHPALLASVLSLAKKNKAAWVRNSRQDVIGWMKRTQKRSLVEFLHGSVYFWLTRGLNEELHKLGFFTFDRLFGLLETFSFDKAYLSKLLDLEGEGNCEVFLHPGAAWNRDLDILLDPEIIGKLRRQDRTRTEARTDSSNRKAW